MTSGEYYLQGARETASGLRFNADSTFDFFFSYGAMDRAARGTWRQQGKLLMLNTPRKPEKDFVLAESKTSPEQQVIIQISDPNANILRYVECQITTPGGDTLAAQADQDGRIVFDKIPVRTIALVHTIWSDRISTFEVPDTAHNYFVFTIAPTIVEVEFVDLTLRIVDARTLVGGHPLLQGLDWEYSKGE